MKPRNILSTICILLSNALFPQDFNEYKPLECKGKIPIDFTMVSSEEFEKASEDINKKDKRFDKKSQKKFHLMNSFNLHDLVYSGKLLYNDQLSLYANKVLDEILKNDKSLRSKLRLYVVKSPYVNAFATNNGMILINEGLIAQLENEAQLAFILCHEITHFTKKHVLNTYVKKEQIKSGRTGEDFHNNSEKLFALNKFSKETEKEADEVGLELFKKTKYDLSQLQGVFDVLEYSYLPFDEIKYEKSFLELSNYKFPSKYYPDTLKELPNIENEDGEDGESTHPSIPKRRLYVENSIKGIDNKDRKKFITSTEKEFLTIRKIARYELVDEYINEGHYPNALYSIFLLQKEEPQSIYLEKAKAKCIYGITKYKNAKEYRKIGESYSDIYGESQPLHYLLNEIPANEFNIYAIKTIWALQKKNPKVNIYQRILDDLMLELASNHYDNLADFNKSFPPAKTIDTLSKQENTTKESNSKYDKIKKKKSIEDTQELEYYKYAFVDELATKEFTEKFEKISTEYTKNKKYKKTKEYVDDQKNKKKRIKKKGHRLGIDKIVIASPFYVNVDERKKTQIRYLDSEESEQKFLNTIQENAVLNRLDFELLDDINVKTSTTEKYNDFAFINEWLTTRSKERKSDINMIDLDKEKTDAFIKKYNTKYVCWMGTVALREKKEMVGTYIMLAFLIYPAPFVIPYLFTPEYDTYFYTIVYDIEKREPMMTRYDLINRKDSKGQINSIVYDTFYQIKKN